GGGVQGTTPTVCTVLETCRLYHLDHFAASGETEAAPRVHLHNIHALRLDHVTVGLRAPLILARSNRGHHRRPQARVGTQIGRRQRLLDPPEVERLPLAKALNRGGDVPDSKDPGDINYQGDIFPDYMADLSKILQVPFPILAEHGFVAHAPAALDDPIAASLEELKLVQSPLQRLHVKENGGHGRNRTLELPAEQSSHGLPQELTFQIPQGHVNRTD